MKVFQNDSILLPMLLSTPLNLSVVESHELMIFAATDLKSAMVSSHALPIVPPTPEVPDIINGSATASIGKMYRLNQLLSPLEASTAGVVSSIFFRLLLAALLKVVSSLRNRSSNPGKDENVVRRRCLRHSDSPFSARCRSPMRLFAATIGGR